MKKIIIAVFLVAVVAGGFFILMGNKDKNDKTNPSAQTDKATVADEGKAACELLTLEDAKKIIGENATLAEGSGAPNLATTESVDVDNCTYSADGATLGDFKQITIQRHFGNEEQIKLAYASTRKEFPGEATPGLGDEAYITTEGKQVHVIKGKYWLQVFGGSINAGEEANKELAIKSTQLALEKL